MKTKEEQQLSQRSLQTLMDMYNKIPKEKWEEQQKLKAAK